MPEFTCPECGKRLFHENETTLKVEETIHSKFCRKEGCTLNEVKHLLDDLTLHGSIPEPIRVSQLLAKTLFEKGLSF